MNLTPREKDKLLIAMAAIVAVGDDAEMALARRVHGKAFREALDAVGRWAERWLPAGDETHEDAGRPSDAIAAPSVS